MAGCPRQRPELGSSEENKESNQNRTAEFILESGSPETAFETTAFWGNNRSVTYFLALWDD